MLKRTIYLFAFVALLFACSSSDDSVDDNGDGFDRTLLLTNVADNVIMPAFVDLQTELSALDVAKSNFINDRSIANLETLSNSWLEAYKVWQYVQIYNIGEADNFGGGERGFVSFFNIYPVTVSDIETGARTGDYDLNSSNYHDAQGFPALDFLIHGVATGDNLPIDKFMSNSEATGYVTYLTDVVAQMITLNNRIVNSWQSGYRDIFVGNTQSGLNGSFNKIANDITYSYEKDFRAQKIGIPAGNFSDGGSLPEKVEGFYKRDVSKLLALEALTAIENLFNGTAYNSSEKGASFSTYLEFLDREDLVTEINNQFSAGRNALNGLNSDFYQQVVENNSQMTAAYDVIQAAVPKLKVDMKQALNFVIDYVDGDGD